MAASDDIECGVEVLVAGLGVDGELREHDLVRRAADLHGETTGRLSIEQIDRYQPIFDWHPSEAAGFLWAAAMGARGRVEIRGDRLAVDPTDRSSDVFTFQHADVMAASRLAQGVADSASLAEADTAVATICGVSELEYEARKAAQRSAPDGEVDVEEAVSRLDRYGALAAERGVDYLTVRRIGEVLGCRSRGYPRSRRLHAAPTLALLPTPLASPRAGSRRVAMPIGESGPAAKGS